MLKVVLPAYCDGVFGTNEYALPTYATGGGVPAVVTVVAASVGSAAIMNAKAAKNPSARSGPGLKSLECFMCDISVAPGTARQGDTRTARSARGGPRQRPRRFRTPEDHAIFRSHLCCDTVRRVCVQLAPCHSKAIPHLRESPNGIFIPEYSESSRRRAGQAFRPRVATVLGLAALTQRVLKH